MERPNDLLDVLDGSRFMAIVSLFLYFLLSL